MENQKWFMCIADIYWIPALKFSEIKKGKPNIAPLQPPTLATFRSWGSSAGAGRAGLPGAKIEDI